MSLYLTPAALGYLTQLILGTLIGGYLVARAWQPDRTRHIVLLASFFVAFTSFIASLFLEAALLPTPRLRAVFVQNALLGTALILLLQFAYHFPALPAPLRREARLALVLSVLYTLWEAGYAIFRFARLETGVVLYRPPWSDYALLLLLVWVPVAFIRQITARADDGGSLWARWGASILHPATGEARAARTFALIFLFVTGMSLLNILRNVYLVTVALANMGLSVGMLAAMFAFAVAYLNYLPEATSFMVKLAGVTLTALLAGLAAVGWVISGPYETQFQPDLPAPRTLRFTPNDVGGYDVAEVPFTFERDLGDDLHLGEEASRACSPPLDFSFPFFGRATSQVYVCNDGTLGVGQAVPYRAYQYRYGGGVPLIIALLTDLYPQIGPGGVFAHQQPDRLVVTWDRVRGFYQQDAEFTFQLVLHPDGVFEITHASLPDRLAFHADDTPGASLWAVGALPGGLDAPPRAVSLTALPLQSGPEGVVQDFHLAFRQHMNTLLLPLTRLILIASVLIVIVFPLLFRHTLTTPLRALLRGVQRLEAGDYAANVPTRYADEIGFLAQAFNRLAAELGDLVHNLEVRVAARTEALDATNAQLRAEIAGREQAQETIIQQQRDVAAFEEREHLIRELHDGLGQAIGYINVQAQATRDLLAEGKVEAAQANLADLAQAAQEAYADIRSHILGLSTRETTSPHLFATLRDYVQQFGERHAIATSLSLPDDAPTSLFAPAVEEQLLRIIQEALTNVHKHAQASRVEVLFSRVGDKAQFIISDDGIGFQVAQNDRGGPGGSKDAPSGLPMMRERARQIGGQLEVRSAPGQGTRVVLILPCPLAAAAGEDAVKRARLLLVDDHHLFLEGLRDLLLMRGMTVVGLAHDGLEALEKARALHPDVIVMDLIMPRCDGLEATRAIKAELPDVRILVLTAAEEEERLIEAIRSGASGYLLKKLDADQFCDLLADFLRGEFALAPGMAERLLAEFARLTPTAPSRPDERQPAPLTARQWEILRMVAEGRTYKEIGQALYLSEQAIKYHMAQILERLHVENRAQAIAYLHRTGRHQ